MKSYTNTLVKVIDIGSSVFFHDDLQHYVQTRSYRSPEIILGCQYTEKIDIWSLGCIIAELFTGQVLFESDSKAGILAKIQGLRGPWPSWMLQTGTEVPKYFTKELILFEEITEETGEEGKRKIRKTGFTRIYLPKLTNLQSRIQSDNKNFIDFLSKCLKIDPSTRISAKEALNHPFITVLIP
jgi:serine/threonine protein kinase